MYKQGRQLWKVNQSFPARYMMALYSLNKVAILCGWILQKIFFPCFFFTHTSVPTLLAQYMITEILEIIYIYISIGLI